MTRGAGLLALLALVACGGGPTTTKPERAVLGEGAPARVGSDVIATRTVAAISQRQGLSPRTAASAAVSDALLAAGARESLPPSTLRSIARATLARGILEGLAAEAARRGAPTAAELGEIVRDRWPDLDRPEAVRTTHAVVLNDKPERDAAARALATRLASALSGITDSDDFVQRAKAFAADGFQIKAEKLPFIARDGRAFERRDSGFVASRSSFDLDFAKAAAAVERAGQLAPVAKSSFGYHVILLEERLPAHSVPKAELSALLTPEVVARRAGKARQELLAQLRQATPIQPDRAVEELTASVKVTP